MSLIRHISKEQAHELKGKKYNSTATFNPRIDATGKWFISKEEADQIDSELFPELSYLKNVIDEPHEELTEAQDLSFVFKSDNISSLDYDNILGELAENNKILNPVIRVEGSLTFTNEEARNKLIEQGIIFIDDN